MSTKCPKCDSAVYPNDAQITLDTVKFHKSCAKCADCSCQITLSNFTKNGNELLCKTHYFKRFNETNSYTGGDNFKHKTSSDLSRGESLSSFRGSSVSSLGSVATVEEAEKDMAKLSTTTEAGAGAEAGAEAEAEAEAVEKADEAVLAGGSIFSGMVPDPPPQAEAEAEAASSPTMSIKERMAALDKSNSSSPVGGATRESSTSATSAVSLKDRMASFNNGSSASNSCGKCTKTVYPNDPQVVLDGTKYHKACAKCEDCSCQITIANFTKAKELLLCKTHYFERFNKTNSYIGGDDFKQKSSSDLSKGSVGSAS